LRARGGVTANAMHTSRSADAQADKADWAQRVRPGGSDSSERGVCGGDMEFQRSGAGGLPSASPERAKCGKESVY
jgi:hypothetical protein